MGVGVLKHAASVRDLKTPKLLDAVTETDDVQRNKIIAELVSTERDYCRDLDFVVEVNEDRSALFAYTTAASDGSSINKDVLG